MRRIDRGSNYLCSYKYSSKWHDRGRLRLLRRNNGTEDRVRLETDNDDNDLVAARPTMPPSKDHPHTLTRRRRCRPTGSAQNRR